MEVGHCFSGRPPSSSLCRRRRLFCYFQRIPRGSDSRRRVEVDILQELQKPSRGEIEHLLQTYWHAAQTQCQWHQTMVIGAYGAAVGMRRDDEDDVPMYQI